MKNKEKIQIICGIYEIKNIHKDIRYIGSSKDIGKRWKNHLNYLKKNKHRNSYLQNVFNKHGFDNFTFSIIEECSEEDLKIREQYYIDLYGKDRLYNLTMSTVGGGSDVLCNPLYLLDLDANIIQTFNSGADCARFFNRSLLSYKNINTSGTLLVKGAKERYRLVTPQFYEANLEEILTWKKIFNVSEFKSQEFKKRFTEPKYKIIKEDEEIIIAHYRELVELFNITLERARQIITGNLPYIFKNPRCIIAKIDDTTVTKENLIKPVKRKKTKEERKYADKYTKDKLVLLDMKGNDIGRFNSGVELSWFLGKDAIRYRKINTKATVKNYNTDTRHRIVSVEFYENNQDEILSWPTYTSHAAYNRNFRTEYHLFDKDGNFQLKFKMLKTLSKFLNITEEAVRVCILKGGFHKKSEYQINEVEVDKNKY